MIYCDHKSLSLETFLLANKHHLEIDQHDENFLYYLC
jgi:hypothetical protein